MLFDIIFCCLFLLLKYIFFFILYIYLLVAFEYLKDKEWHDVYCFLSMIFFLLHVYLFSVEIHFYFVYFHTFFLFLFNPCVFMVYKLSSGIGGTLKKKSFHETWKKCPSVARPLLKESNIKRGLFLPHRWRRVHPFTLIKSPLVALPAPSKKTAQRQMGVWLTVWRENFWNNSRE